MNHKCNLSDLSVTSHTVQIVHSFHKGNLDTACQNPLYFHVSEIFDVKGVTLTL